MKIVSPFKDFYDFAAGYDTDDRKVYVRKTVPAIKLDVPDADRKVKFMEGMCSSIILNEDRQYIAVDIDYFIGIVFFCGERHYYFQDVHKDAFYYRYSDVPEDTIKTVDDKLRLTTRGLTLKAIMEPEDFKKEMSESKQKWEYYWAMRHLERFGFEDMNKTFNVPVITVKLRDKRYVEVLANGRLTDVKFGSAKSPRDAYVDVYNWVPFVEPEPDSDPSNMNRFEQKGFDKKTSFRNVK